MDDKLYKYLVKDNSVSFDEETSYMKYLDDCKNFIYEDDIDNYVESLSISKLENEKNGLSLTYKMKDMKIGTYREYNNSINLYDYNGKKLIVVLVSLVKNAKKYVTMNESVKNSLETKISKMVDSVSLSILKIHNIINNDTYIQPNLIPALIMIVVYIVKKSLLIQY